MLGNYEKRLRYYTHADTGTYRRDIFECISHDFPFSKKYRCKLWIFISVCIDNIRTNISDFRNCIARYFMPIYYVRFAEYSHWELPMQCAVCRGSIKSSCFWNFSVIIMHTCMHEHNMYQLFFRSLINW